MCNDPKEAACLSMEYLPTKHDRKAKSGSDAGCRLSGWFWLIVSLKQMCATSLSRRRQQAKAPNIYLGSGSASRFSSMSYWMLALKASKALHPNLAPHLIENMQVLWSLFPFPCLLPKHLVLQTKVRKYGASANIMVCFLGAHSLA